MTVQSFFLHGIPTAQGRPKFFRRGSFVGAYDPKKSAQAKETVVAQVVALKPKLMEGPIELEMIFYMPRPKAHYKRDTLRTDAPVWCDKKPDIDNIAKLLFDAFSQSGMIWRDDSQVVILQCVKRYSEDNLIGVNVMMKEAV